MNVSQSFRLALKSLMVSKVRALLTMLGIIIGVTAVIVIVGLGNGMTQSIKPSASRPSTLRRMSMSSTVKILSGWWTTTNRPGPLTWWCLMRAPALRTARASAGKP